MTRRDEILAACRAEIARLQRLVAAAERGPVMDWWQTDLVDWFDPADRLCLATPDDGGELLDTRIFYRVQWERDDRDWRATGVERLQVFVSISDLLPAVDVTAQLGDEILAGYREMACEDAENKRDQRELADRAAEDYYARME